MALGAPLPSFQHIQRNEYGFEDVYTFKIIEDPNRRYWIPEEVGKTHKIVIDLLSRMKISASEYTKYRDEYISIHVTSDENGETVRIAEKKYEIYSIAYFDPESTQKYDQDERIRFSILNSTRDYVYSREIKPDSLSKITEIFEVIRSFKERGKIVVLHIGFHTVIKTYNN